MKDYEKLSREHFDAQAEIYDEKDTYSYSKFPKISCADIEKRLKNTEFEKMLDIGCGTAHLIDLLLKTHDKAEFYGIDISPNMIEQAKKKVGDKATFTLGSADSLPYDDNTFDIVCCVQSFHHYPYPEKAVSEAFRVLKPNGLYIISDSGFKNKGFLQKFENSMLKLMNTGDFHAYCCGEVESLMKNGGFKIKEKDFISKFIFTIVAQKN